MEPDKICVYIAGPYDDVRTAIRMGHELRYDGFFSLIPHLWRVAELVCLRTTEERVADSQSLIAKSDCLLRLKGESQEIDDEVAYAISRDLPVFTNYKELLAHFREGSNGRT